MIEYTAKADKIDNRPARSAANRHRKRKHMGKFATEASQHDLDKRGDGYCVSGRWIAENLDEEDLVEFIRLASGHKWDLIIRLSDNQLRHNSLQRHVHGACPCFDGLASKGCCVHDGSNS